MATRQHTPSDEDRLKELGFVEAGSWELIEGKPQIEFTQHGDVRPALYALVENGRVVYVGKSIKSLAHRMAHYQNPGSTQRTSLRNHASIRTSLDAGQMVKVYVFVNELPITFRGITINLAAGLEDPLISLFQPAWNKVGKSTKD